MPSLDEEFDALPDAPSLDAEFDSLPDAPEEPGFFDKLQRINERARTEAAPGLADAINPFAAIPRLARTAGIALEELGADDVGQVVQDASAGARQGMTLGFADELDAAGGAVASEVKDRLLGQDEMGLNDIGPARRDKSLVGRYRAQRDALRTQDAASQERSPWAYGIGEVAGGVAVPIPGGTAKTGLTVAQRFAQAVKTGSKLGAAHGLGTSDADLTRGDVAGAVKDIAVGGALGAAGGVVGQGLGEAASMGANAVTQRLAPAVQDFVQDFAQKRALKASGYIKKDIKPLAREDIERVAERGQVLLDEPGLISPLDDVEDVARKLVPAVDRYGQGIGRILDTADSLGGRFDMQRFTQRARQELLDPLRVGSSGQFDPAKARKAEALDRLISQYEQLGAGGGGFRAANQLKTNLQSEINFGNKWNEAAPDHQEFLKDLQRILLDEVDSQLDQQFGAAVPQIGQKFKEVKRRYGALIEALTKAKESFAGEVGNDFTSLKDKIIGGTIAGGGVAPAIMAGDPTMALGSAALGAFAGLGNKVLRARGASTAAALGRGAANTMQRIQGLLQANPQALGRFAPILQRAALAGERQLATTHFILAQREPEYREMMAQQEQDETLAQR